MKQTIKWSFCAVTVSVGSRVVYCDRRFFRGSRLNEGIVSILFEVMMGVYVLGTQFSANKFMQVFAISYESLILGAFASDRYFLALLGEQSVLKTQVWGNSFS